MGIYCCCMELDCVALLQQLELSGTSERPLAVMSCSTVHAYYNNHRECSVLRSIL